MIQNGGWLVSKNGKKATVNSAANVQAFNYVKKMLGNGSMKLTNQLGVGWGGEGFGKKMCAMTIEGNWIAGAMKNDYPSVGYKVVQLPRGPKGQGTLQYDGGWGLAAASKNKADAMKLISFLTNKSIEMGMAKAFGVMPSIMSAKKQWLKAVPAVVVLPRRRELLEEHPAGPRNRDGSRRLQPAAAGAPEHEPEDDPRPGQYGAAGDSPVTLYYQRLRGPDGATKPQP